MEFFWSIFCRVGTEYGETWTRKTPYSNTFHVLLQFSFVYEILVISFSFGMYRVCILFYCDYLMAFLKEWLWQLFSELKEGL